MNAHTVNAMAMNHGITLAMHAFQIMPPVHRTRSASGATRKGRGVRDNWQCFQSQGGYIIYAQTQVFLL